MVARHIVVVPGPDGSPVRVAMKAWLKQHPELFPGIDLLPLTSHQQRKLLLKAGWKLEIGADEVLLTSPQLTAEQATAFIEAFEAESEATEDAAEDNEAVLSFELEHQLRDFIIANLPYIPVQGKILQLYKDPAGKTGREYPTGVGYIDILAQDSDGALYVFELKKGKSPDSAVGQILRYIGWLTHHTSPTPKVYGVIVSKETTEKLKYAVSVVPNLYAFAYDVTFSLKPSSLI